LCHAQQHQLLGLLMQWLFHLHELALRLLKQ